MEVVAEARSSLAEVEGGAQYPSAMAVGPGNYMLVPVCMVAEEASHTVMAQLVVGCASA